MTAREEFNRMLNESSHPRRIYNALSALVSDPDVKKTDDMGQKRAVIGGKLNIIINETGLNEAIKQAV